MSIFLVFTMLNLTFKTISDKIILIILLNATIKSIYTCHCKKAFVTLISLNLVNTYIKYIFEITNVCRLLLLHQIPCHWQIHAWLQDTPSHL